MDKIKDITVLSKLRRGDEVIGYNMVGSSGKIQYLPKAKALTYRNRVENAYVKNNHYYTKPGHKQIETIVQTQASVPKVVDANSLKVKAKKKEVEAFKRYRGKEFVDVCNEIRTCAREGRITIDETGHFSNDGSNVDFLYVIKSCGCNLYDIIREYLSFLQPYSLCYYYSNGEMQAQAGMLFLVEFGYDTDMIIKVNTNGNDKDALVISFHESNKDRVKANRVSETIQDNEACGLIVENAKRVGDKYQSDVILMHGMIKKKVSPKTKNYSDGIILVQYSEIKQLFNRYITDMYNSLIANEFDVMSDEDEDGGINDRINRRKKQYRNYSFMAFGDDFSNVMYYLIDLQRLEPDIEEKKNIITLMYRLIEVTEQKKLEDFLSGLEHVYKDETRQYLYKLVKKKCKRQIKKYTKRQIRMQKGRYENA